MLQTPKRARRKPVPRWTVTDSSIGLSVWGPYVTDAVSGILIEKRKAVRQRGGWVSAQLADGTRDLPDWSRRP